MEEVWRLEGAMHSKHPAGILEALEMVDSISLFNLVINNGFHSEPSPLVSYRKASSHQWNEGFPHSCDAAHDGGLEQTPASLFLLSVGASLLRRYLDKTGLLICFLPWLYAIRWRWTLKSMQLSYGICLGPHLKPNNQLLCLLLAILNDGPHSRLPATRPSWWSRPFAFLQLEFSFCFSVSSPC